MRLKSRFLMILLALCLCVAPALSQVAVAQQKFQATTESAWGLHTSTFDTLHGKVIVNLPDDMSAGDTLSGTVIAEPIGKTEEERRRNTDELNGYVVEVEKARTPVIKEFLQWTIPATLAGGVTYLILRDNEGKEVARTEIAVQPTPPVIARPTKPALTDYSLPIIGQAGRPVQIPGLFDGNSSNTGVKIGGQRTRVLAESPRKAVVESPLDIVGPTEIELREGDVVAKGKLNNLRVKLTASKTTLRKGEGTTVTARVEGLRGLPPQAYPIPLEMVNRTPEIVRFEEGAGQAISHSIPHSSVSPGGTYSFATQVRGIRPGTFSIALRSVALLGDWLCCQYDCTNPRGKMKTVRWCKDVPVGTKCPRGARYGKCECVKGVTKGECFKKPYCTPDKCNTVGDFCD